MTFNPADISIVLPEILMLSFACVILVTDLYISEQRRGLIHLLSVGALIFTAVATLRLHDGQEAMLTTYAFSGTFIRDQMGDVLKVFVFVTMALVFVYAKPYLRARGLFKGEFFVLSLMATLGMMIMISSANMLLLYLGLELLALSTYALTALDRDNKTATEAAMKYFVLGALASGLLLYGMSMIYGATGSLDLATIKLAVTGADANDIVLVFGLVFVVVGLAFKLGAVPFHMWIPDVYQGAPTAVTALIGSAPKIAAFALVYRLLEDGLTGLHEYWQQMLIILAILSLAIGNIVAIAQVNLKRMLAYSTISHVGFILLGILAGTKEGYQAAMFYTIVYALMSSGAFGFIILLSRAGFEADRLEDYKGLNQRSPWYAFIMLLFMGSLAGFPPFIGFWAKLHVIKAAVGADLAWLAAVAVAFAVIGAFYYLRVIKLMYMDPPETDEPIEPPADLATILSANGLAQLALGIMPGPLVAICAAAI